ncbi:hypothetical protein [Burkholderia sp. S-53]|uniref:hypothetical protein n=1 Tax=Burkholderia sp. S-53 TaxID=2906514 RepID=UPI0021D17C38|nr:hypothetical protein [Burkholderia sp. S-53]UXU90781.1 hypothetical protein LXM88_36485 [Burkholderia sp. S-53]
MEKIKVVHSAGPSCKVPCSRAGNGIESLAEAIGELDHDGLSIRESLKIIDREEHDKSPMLRQYR